MHFPDDIGRLGHFWSPANTTLCNLLKPDKYCKDRNWKFFLIKQRPKPKPQPQIRKNLKTGTLPKPNKLFRFKTMK